MNKLFSFLKKLFKRSVDERRYAVSHLKTTAFIAGERIEQGQVVNINPDNGRAYAVRQSAPVPFGVVQSVDPTNPRQGTLWLTGVNQVSARLKAGLVVVDDPETGGYKWAPKPMISPGAANTLKLDGDQ